MSGNNSASGLCFARSLVSPFFCSSVLFDFLLLVHSEMIGKCDSTYTALAQEPSLDPPSYFPGASTPDLQASTSGAPYPITTNQLAISHTSTPIKSVYHIDTSAVVPPHVLGPSVSADPGPSIARLFGLEGSAAEGTGAGQARPNAVFKTKSGSIDVDLHVRGGERAVILVESTYDAVKVAIVSSA